LSDFYIPIFGNQLSLI